MKKAVKLAIPFIFFAGALQLTFALDFGGSLDNITGAYWSTLNSSLQPTQQDTLTAWLSAPVGSVSKFYVQGSYEFTLDRYYLFDLDLLYLDTTFTKIPNGPARIDLMLGRFVGSDMSGFVLNHRMDGFRLDFGYPGADLSLTAGYTGLLLKPNSTIIMSHLDTVDQGTTSIVLASPRLVGSLALTFPQLFALQTLGLDLVYQKDLHTGNSVIKVGETTQDLNRGGLLDTQYIGLELGGPVTPTFFYNLFGYLNLGTTLSYVSDSTSPSGSSYQNEPILAYAVGLKVDLYPAFMRSHLGLEGLFSSGDADATTYNEGNTSGTSTTFVPMSQDTTYAVVFTPQLGNLARVGINFSLKPFGAASSDWLRTFQAEVKAFGFFRPNTNQAVSAGGAVPGVGGPYLGSEIDGYIRVRPYSDFGLVLSSGVFLPNKGSGQPFPADEPIGFKVALEGVITF